MDSPSRSSFIPSPQEGMYHKMKYYDKLSQVHPELSLKVPAHVFNPALFLFSHAQKQKSWMTIFR